jgi:hypothetical protein
LPRGCRGRTIQTRRDGSGGTSGRWQLFPKLKSTTGALFFSNLATLIRTTTESNEGPCAFIADRPFLWAIVDEKTGSVLDRNAVRDL